jgi:hypothetical protein
MTNKETILNWLTTGFQQPSDRLSELFYYDKRDDQFFSVLVTDYFLFDNELNLAKDVTSTYSKKSLESLQDRIKRIENNDLNIVAIPRLGQMEEREIKMQMNLFMQTSNIDLDTVTIWETEDKGTITINIAE